MDESISVDECAKRMNKSHLYVRNAIKNHTMPGSYTVSEGGYYSYHIPRAAFEDYMTKWNPNPSVELVQALIDLLQNKKSLAATRDK